MVMYLFTISVLLLRGKKLSVFQKAPHLISGMSKLDHLFYLVKSKVILLLKLLVPLFDYKLE